MDAEGPVLGQADVNRGRRGGGPHRPQDLARELGKDGPAHDVIHVPGPGLDLGAARGDLIDDRLVVGELHPVGLRQAFSQFTQFEHHDVLHDLRIEDVERHHGHPGQERRFEVMAQDRPDSRHQGLHGRAFAGGAHLRDHVRSEIARQEDDRVLEVDHAALAVGEHALVEDLIEEVHDLEVGLFHLIQEHHRIGALANRLGQHAAFAVSDVARR